MSILGNALRRNGWWQLGSESIDRLPGKTQRALALAGDRIDVWPGQAVLRQAAPVLWVFVVLDGELVLRRAGQDLRILRAGSLYGALEAYGGGGGGGAGHARAHCPGDLVARDISRVLAVPSRAFTGLVGADPAFAEWVLRAVAVERREGAA